MIAILYLPAVLVHVRCVDNFFEFVAREIIGGNLPRFDAPILLAGLIEIHPQRTQNVRKPIGSSCFFFLGKRSVQPTVAKIRQISRRKLIEVDNGLLPCSVQKLATTEIPKVLLSGMFQPTGVSFFQNVSTANSIVVATLVAFFQLRVFAPRRTHPSASVVP